MVLVLSSERFIPARRCALHSCAVLCAMTIHSPLKVSSRTILVTLNQFGSNSTHHVA